MPTPSLPRFSIVLPTFNAGDFLEETLDNLFSQDYPDVEFFIIDGGSRDRTVEIIRRHEHRLAGWVSEPDEGQSDAINKGFARATGPLHYWANADDLLEPGALRHVASLVHDFDAPRWVVGAAKLIDGRGRDIGRRTQDRVDDATFLMWALRWIPTQSVFWNAAMWRVAGPFDKDLHYTMDLALWQRMYRAAPPILTDRVLGHYRLHELSKSLTSFQKGRSERKANLARIIARDMREAAEAGPEALAALAARHATLIDELTDQAALVERLNGNRLTGPAMKVYRRLARWTPELDV